MEEKRQFTRFKDNLDIKYNIFSAPKDQPLDQDWEGESSILDISKGGILFKYDIPIPVGSFMEVEIHVPETDMPLYLKGKVIRVEEIALNKEYEIGFIFSNIFENDLKLLEKHLSKLEDK